VSDEGVRDVGEHQVDAGGDGKSGPGPSGWQAPEATGVRTVDDAVGALRELDELPTAEHVAYFETVHRHLQDALADIDGA
jgi:hypothetical protein